MRRISAWQIPLLLACAAARADDATRLIDLRSGAGNGVDTLHATVFQGKLYFRGTDDGSQFDLWVYDGANAPSVVPGGEAVSPATFAVWNGELYFRGGPSSDRELWRYDGVSAPEIALDIDPTGNASPTAITPFGDRICFAARIGSSGLELVCWDGLSSPDLYNINTGALDSLPDNLVVFSDRLVFAATQLGDRELWALGSVGAPARVADLSAGGDSNPRASVVVGNELFFDASSNATPRPWRWDGIAAPEIASSTLAPHGAIVVFRGRPHYFTHDAQPVTKLYRFDDPQWTLVSGAGGTSQNIPAASVIDDAIYFLKPEGDNGTDLDLYRHCGTGEATRLTDAFAGASAFLLPGRPVAFAGRLYFAATEPGGGAELWSAPLTHVFCDGFGDGSFSAWSSSFGARP